jgi:hypothetical protein
MPFVGLEHASVQLLGFRQAPLRMAGEGLFERLEDRAAGPMRGRGHSLAHDGNLFEENDRNGLATKFV